MNSPEKPDLALMRARAVHELALQQPVAVMLGNAVLGSALAAEFIDEKQWEQLKQRKPLLLLSPARLRLLGVSGSAFDASRLTLGELWEMVAGDAKAYLSKAAPAAQPDYAQALISLTKQAGILPALLWFAGDDLQAQRFSLEALSYSAPAEMVRGETVSLPLDGAENSTLTSFRTRYGAGVHLALTIGKPNPLSPPLVRVHSSCVTGDLLGSLRCDCGGQLRAAIQQMKEETTGILLYLYQEGRDIGITSKLRAYALQERGMDTFTANQQLGFEEDERDFGIASAILSSLGYTQVRLLTNNPDKIDSFEKAGIRVTSRVPLIAGGSPHSEHYIDAKKTKRGHLF